MRARTGLVAGVLAVVAAGAVAVAVGGALLLTHIVDLRRSVNATLRAGNYLEATIGVESLVVDAETGLRGYVITGQPLFLAPERTAAAQMPAAAGALRRAAASDGADVTQASALAASARSYLSTYVPRVIEQVRTNPAAAQSDATTVLGKRLVDGIRQQTARLEHLISANQATRQRAARASADHAVAVGIVVLIALTALTVALGGILGRLVIGRERARERASFLAEASARLDLPVTSREVLDTFVGLVLKRGNQLCLAEELAGGETRPEGQPGRARAGDAALEVAVGSSEAQDAWNAVRRTAETRARTAAHATAAYPDAGEQRVHVLTVAGVARGSLVTRVLVARRGRDWRPEEIDELIGLTERLALALHARALYARTESLYRASEQTAITLQRSLLPGEIPDVPSCELAIRFAPAGAGDLVGGDFYDVFPVGSNHWAVVIGDVCGKGAGAAAVTAMARWTLRSLAGAVRSPAEVLRIVNDTMLRQPLEQRFITILYALLDVRGPDARVTVACGGHPPAILVGPDGAPENVAAWGDLLGVWPDVRLQQAVLRLRPGESLVLYTDGVTDRGPGVDGSAEQALRNLAGEPNANTLADALLDEAGRRNGGAQDDVAIVAVRFVPEDDGLGGEPGLTVGTATA